MQLVLTSNTYIKIVMVGKKKKKKKEKRRRKIQLVLSSSYCFALCLIFIWSFFSCQSVTQYTCMLICLLDLFNVGLSPERFWRGPRPHEVGRADPVPNTTPSPPERFLN